jgi:hypothetical protein
MMTTILDKFKKSKKFYTPSYPITLQRVPPGPPINGHIHNTQMVLQFVRCRQGQLSKMASFLHIKGDNIPESPTPTMFNSSVWTYAPVDKQQRVLTFKNNNVAYLRGQAQKGYILSSQIVRAHTQPGDTVFIPYGGTGTEAVAAMLQDRRAVVCEVQQACYNQMRARIVRCFEHMLGQRTAIPSNAMEFGAENYKKAQQWWVEQTLFKFKNPNMQLSTTEDLVENCERQGLFIIEKSDYRLTQDTDQLKKGDSPGRGLASNIPYEEEEIILHYTGLAYKHGVFGMDIDKDFGPEHERLIMRFINPLLKDVYLVASKNDPCGLINSPTNLVRISIT